MIEITISRSKKINTGNYESVDIFAAVKVTMLDDGAILLKFNELNKEVEAFIEAETLKVKEKKDLKQ